MEEAFRNKSKYSIPVIFKDQANDLKNIEAEANQALQNIRSLYQDVMNPESHDEYNVEYESDTSDLSEASHVSEIKRCTIGLRNIPIKTKSYYNSQRNCKCCSMCYCHCQSLNEIPNNRNITLRSHSFPRSVSTESEYYYAKDNTNKSYNESKSKVKITVPEPFSFSENDSKRMEVKQLKLSKLKDELNHQMEKELNVKVVSKPVPKHTHLPLYKEMARKTEGKKAERKEKCAEIIKKGNKPLTESFQSGSSKKSDNTGDDLKYSFKASPLPKNILSDKVTQRLRNKEEIRKMLIAHRAEEMLKQSSSPLSKKNIPRSFSISNLSDYKKESTISNGLKPNITAITNRLYNKKCKETMENWDKKVIRYCMKENVIESKTSVIIKPKFQPEQKLPFLYYPVRMSTAATLREKQIRSEILAREKREENMQNNENVTDKAKQEIQEEIYKRLQTLIPVNDFEKEIEEKVKSYKESHFTRKMEYEKELEEIMMRVSKQYLLMERQSKNKNFTYKEDTTEHDRHATAQELSSDSKSIDREEADSLSEAEESEETHSSLESRNSSD